MKNKFFALFTVCFLALNLVGTAFADTKTNKIKKQTNSLAARLPTSDGVMTVDLKRFVNNALPQILSGNQPVLSKITGAIDELKNNFGIDLRQFDQLAVGVTAKQISAKEYDFEPVVIAQGQYNAGALLGLIKLASDGKYREEKIGGKVVYIFSAREAMMKNKPQTGNPAASKGFERMFAGLLNEVAISSLDEKTIAFGTLERVRQTIEAKTKVAADLSSLLNRNTNPILSFAGKIPGKLSVFVPFDNDELGKNLDAIRYLYGSMDVAGDNTNLQLLAKTTTNAQAQDLLETLQGLQLVGKALLGSAKGADKQIYARMIENAKFKRATNEVTLDLSVSQTDINVLTGYIR